MRPPALVPRPDAGSPAVPVLREEVPQVTTCACHGEELLWHRDSRYRAGGFWYCRITHQERARAKYDALDGVAYNQLLLRHRRHKALDRQRQRLTGEGVTSG